jgi:hypothetical protein
MPDPVQVLKIAGPLAEGAYLGAALNEPVNERQKAIYARFLKKYPARDWNSGYYTHSDLFTCLTKAIEKCQSFDPVTIAKTLENLTWEDPYGPASFGGKMIFGIKRQLLQHVNLLKVVNGKVVWLTSAAAPDGILD